MSELRRIITDADLANMQELQYRDQVLRILFRLHQYKPDELGAFLTPALQQHKARIMDLRANPSTDPDLSDMLQEELKLVERAIVAPTLPF